MSIHQVFKCNECGAERKEANHWFIVTIFSNQICIYKWEKAPELIVESIDAQHLCGRACLSSTLNRWTEQP